MVLAVDDVPRTQAAVEARNGIEHEIDEPWAVWRWRPLHEHELVRNPVGGELLSVETQGAKKPRAKIDAVIVVAPGQDDADGRLARRVGSVRRGCHSRSQGRNDA